VTAAQAFHWFDVERSSLEFRRILRREGWVALIWNRRRVGGNEFLKDYEHFLEEWGRGYEDVRESWDVKASGADVFGGGQVHRRASPTNSSWTSRDWRVAFYRVRTLPHETTRKCLQRRRLFDDHAPGGTGRMTYDTDVYYGRLHEDGPQPGR
jgi:hypothetical protein